MSNNQEWPKNFEFQQVQEHWYRYWEENGCFKAESTSDKPAYCIVIPPPNVTGSLHMGHALNNTLQDVLVRYKRMNGFNVLWQPGMDHAGIATQNVVERQLKAEGKSRHEVGREAFVERVWKWKEESGGTILNQLRRLGASCDWSRARFTLDEGLSRAVKKVFIQLHKDGLIYRGLYLINWCPRCHTALSDLEVTHKDLDGAFYHILYPMADDPSRKLEIATTRPETMLGDTAVAVHPKDDRYSDLHGKKIILPLMNREIPVITDDYVDREFGTGALKVTPGHDFNDFQIGKRHKLEEINILTEEAKINENGGDYAGLDRFEAREKVVADLKEKGLLVKIEPHKQSVGHCYRCDTIIEPYLSMQWFVKVGPLAEPAIEAVKNGDTRIVPAHWEKTYFNWMENIQDWCISRQIWWGHSIPAFHCDDCGHIMVADSAPEKCEKCGGGLTPDPDVLDTWFSSALWPFSTLGWPPEEGEAENPYLTTFYPTACLVTGFDILFFWVARMMMMGLKFQNKVPFKDVYIHALVRDAQGQKMSKSKGNVVDPLSVMDDYGADAFRFTLAAFAAQGRDIKLSEDRVGGYKKFIQKIWNAYRFAGMNLEGYTPPDPFPRSYEDFKDLSPINDWILTKLKICVNEVTEAIELYQFNEAASAVYDFFWHELCDWYLELIKSILYDEQDARKQETQTTLLFVLHQSLRLLHPFMPFITEELYHRLPVHGETIMKESWPERPEGVPEAWISDSAANIDSMIQVVDVVRNIRGENKVKTSETIDVYVNSLSEDVLQGIGSLEESVKKLAGIGQLRLGETPEDPKKYIHASTSKVDVFIPRDQLQDIEEERKRLTKEMAKIDKELEAVNKKLANPKFVDNAPDDIIQKQKDKLADFQSRREVLVVNLANLGS